jgi:DNA-binding response OmpR family regulator
MTTIADDATVLIVEDEALIAMMVEDVLAGAGYRPVHTRDGRPVPFCPGGGGGSAQAAVVGLRCADGLDGRQVVGHLREQRPSVPVVVVTGFDPRAPEADLRGLGGPTVRLQKPFDCDELVERLADMLNGTSAAATPRRRASDAVLAAAA